MKKNISLSFLLRWSISVFLLAASLLPSAVGQTKDVPAIINVTISLDCGDTTFLNPQNNYTGGYDFFITGGSIFGSADADSNVMGSGCSYPVPLGGALNGTALVPPSGTTLSIPITSTVGVDVDAYFNTPCIPFSYPNTAYYAPYSFIGNNAFLNYLLLANGESYYLSSFQSDSVIPKYSGDPNYPGDPNNPTTTYVYGLNSVTHTEIPSVISVSFQCTNSGNVKPTIQIEYVQAVDSSSDILKALLRGFPYSGPISLLVRSGNAYAFSVGYQTGTDPFNDLISFPPYQVNTALLPGCSVTNFIIGLDCGHPLGPCPGSPNSGATITGGFGMNGEYNWEKSFFLEARYGPVGNYRDARFTPLTSGVVTPYYTFTAINVVPSKFFAPGVPDQPYGLFGDLNFGTLSDFEYFQAPTYGSVEAVDCTITNLDVFELCPGHVQGNISLKGPTYGSSPPSPWLSLILDNTTFGSSRSVSPATFQHNPIGTGFDFDGVDYQRNDLNPRPPCNNCYSYSTSSSIGATGGGPAGSPFGDGVARVLFSANPSTDGSTLSGSYDLRLAGLSSVIGASSPSIWDPNQLNLIFYALNSDGNVNMQENLQITDNNFVNQTITCPGTNSHDISYCFGEFDYTIDDTDPTDTTSWTGVSLIGTGTYTANGVSYTTTFNAIGVANNGNGSTTHNTGLIRLFLPGGMPNIPALYTITTTVYTPNGNHTQAPVPIHVYCGITTNNLGNSCLTITNQSVVCIATNNTYAWTFCVTNEFNGPIGYLSFPALPAGVTIDHDILPLNPVLQQGHGTCVTLYLTNTLGTSNLCFTIGAHSTNFFQCCSITNCITFPPCCVALSSETLVGTNNCYSYTFTIKNALPVPINNLFLVQGPAPPPACVTFTPDIITFSPPLGPGQSSVENVKVCTAAGCTGCFLVAAVGSNQWCSIPHCLPAAQGALSSLVTSLKCVDNALHFCLPTTAGATYYVESTTSLSPPQWTVQQTIVGDGSMVTVTNAINATPQQFYRVRAQ